MSKSFSQTYKIFRQNDHETIKTKKSLYIHASYAKRFVMKEKKESFKTNWII